MEWGRQDENQLIWSTEWKGLRKDQDGDFNILNEISGNQDVLEVLRHVNFLWILWVWAF